MIWGEKGAGPAHIDRIELSKGLLGELMLLSLSVLSSLIIADHPGVVQF